MASADQTAESQLVEGDKHSALGSNGLLNLPPLVSWGWGQLMQKWVLRQVTLLQVALESVSATHQLVSAIHTFAICVRPLLLTGFAPNPDSAESGPVDAAEHKVRGLWTSVSGSWYLVYCILYNFHLRSLCTVYEHLKNKCAKERETETTADMKQLALHACVSPAGKG